MTIKIDLNKYSNFVEAVTSSESNNLDAFERSLDRLANNVDNPEVQINVPLLITSAMGLSGESGEFSEIIKKLVFHSKPLTPEVHKHLQKELGDIIWYWTNACRALNVDPNNIIVDNVDKLSSRYPGGKFDPYYSENRSTGDI